MVNIPPIYGDWDVSILDDDLAGILPLQDLESLLHLLPQFSGRPPLFNFALEQTRMYPQKITPNPSKLLYLVLSVYLDRVVEPVAFRPWDVPKIGGGPKSSIFDYFPL